MFIHGDAETLPFTNASFDAIVSRHLLGALSCRDRAFMEWKRLLRPGGKVVVMDGDRTARNDDPFARILPPVTRRLYRSLEREKMHVGNNQSNLQERVVLELERAGYVDIQTYTIADLFPDGERRLRRDHYQRVIVTGRKPRSQ
jgi:ubiquinone/menaquinone biosynthesis C-methylase UbiE